MKVFITGAAGFIGFHISRNLLLNGFEVIGIDNFNDYYPVSLKYDRLLQLGIHLSEIDSNKPAISPIFPKFSFQKIDITHQEALDHFFEISKPDIVCHLAAQAGVRYSLENPSSYAQTNLLGFFNVMEAAKKYKVKHFIYASSSSVYGLNEKFPLEEKDPVDHPVSLYAATKRSNELMAHAYSHLYDLPTTGLRFFTVYGPWGRPDMALIKFTKAIYAGANISLYNQGNMMRDFTYIDDVVDALYAIISRPFVRDKNWNSANPVPSASSAPFQIFNIGNSSPVKMMDYIIELEKATGKKANIELLPTELCELTTTWADSSKLSSNYQLKPGTPLSLGIKHFVAWFKSYYQVD